MRLRPCLVHGLDGASRSKALSSQGPGAFFFSRAATCVDDRTPSCRQARGYPERGTSVLPQRGTGVPLLFLKEDTMSAVSQVNAYRPIGVLLGGSFAPQRSIDPKPVVCALLRPRERLADAADQLALTDSVSAQQAVGHY